MSAKKTSHSSSAFWNVMGSGMMSANTVIMNMLVGHIFDLSEVGTFSLALTTAQILYVIALFGANDLQMTDREKRYRFADYFGLKVFSSLLTVICCAVFLLASGLTSGSSYSKTAAYTILLTLFMLVNSFAELYQSLYFQNGRLDLTGKSLFWRYFVSTLVFAAVAILRKSVTGACVWMLLANVVVTVFWCRRYAPAFRDSGYHPSLVQVRGLMAQTLPLCLSVLGNMVLINNARYLIEAFCSSDIQGVYSLLFMPVYAMNLLAQFIFRPLLYEYMKILGGEEDSTQKMKSDTAFSDRRNAFLHVFLKHTAIIAALTIACAILLYLIGVPLLRIFFGQDISPWRTYLFFFTLSGFLLAINQLLYYILVIMKAQRYILMNYIPAIIVSVCAGLLLIRRWALTGALVSFSIGEAILLGGYVIYLVRAFRSKRR